LKLFTSSVPAEKYLTMAGYYLRHTPLSLAPQFSFMPGGQGLLRQFRTGNGSLSGLRR